MNCCGPVSMGPSIQRMKIDEKTERCWQEEMAACHQRPRSEETMARRDFGVEAR